MQWLIFLPLLWFAQDQRMFIVSTILVFLLPMNIFLYYKEVRKKPEKYSRLVKYQFISLLGIITITLIATFFI